MSPYHSTGLGGALEAGYDDDLTTPLFGDTDIRLLQFLVEFNPGGVPSKTESGAVR